MTLSFSDFQLLAPIQKALQAESYSEPTPIQAAAIPHLLAGRDLLGCAQTGTGKTAAFALPMLQQLDTQRRPAVPHKPRMLILAPTRELAFQIGASFQTYGKHIRFSQAVIYGGVGQNAQVRDMKRGVHLLIATPGRLLDLMNQGHIDLGQIENLVLDEADRMLDMGFLPDLKRIIKCLPKRRQSIFLSATMPPVIRRLAESLLTDHVEVVITPPSTTVAQIDQQVLFVERSDKRALLSKLLQEPGQSRTLVFTRTKRGADLVARQLNQSGVKTDAIHGGKSQNARERILRSFKAGHLRVLVATDLAARGIDIDGISHVINYDIPVEAESYVHRIGRTGRAGALGIALTFCDSSERSTLRAIEKLIGRSITVRADHPYHSTVVEKPSQPRQAQGGKSRWNSRPAGRRTSSGSTSKPAASRPASRRPVAAGSSARKK